MQTTELVEDSFLRILWDEKTRIIGIDWKESTSAMTDEEFKTELALFAGHVEEKKSPRILVDVRHFRHKIGPEVQQWRVQHISSRYNAAGVERFAFLFPTDAPIPAMMNQSSKGEDFLTRAFNSHDQAVAWLTAEE